MSDVLQLVQQDQTLKANLVVFVRALNIIPSDVLLTHQEKHFSAGQPYRMGLFPRLTQGFSGLLRAPQGSSESPQRPRETCQWVYIVNYVCIYHIV